MTKDQIIEELQKKLNLQETIIDDLEERLLREESLRLELNASLKESEALYKSVIENSLDGTAIVDKNFNLVYVNDEITNILGYSENELVGQDIRFYVDKESLINLENVFEKVLESVGNETRFECYLIHQDGTRRNAYVSSSLMDDFQGRKVVVCQILDITEIKKAEEKVLQMNFELEKRVIERTDQLQEALGELRSEITVRKKTEEELQKAKEEVQKALEQEKELNGLKTRFISMISHEYRTPLTVILTSSYLIEQFYQGPHKEQFDKFLGKIRASVKSMTQLLEDVLTIGKSDSGKSNISLDSIRIIDLIEEIIEETEVIDNKKHKFDFQFSNKELAIISDLKSLKHIISNLINNAAKYSPGSNLVNILLQEDEDIIVLFIKDYGIGIPKEDQTLLFEAFHRASNVGAISGTGLGLSIVKRMLDQIKGTISLESDRGLGSTFTITLPKVLMT